MAAGRVWGSLTDLGYDRVEAGRGAVGDGQGATERGRGL